MGETVKAKGGLTPMARTELMAFSRTVAGPFSCILHVSGRRIAGRAFPARNMRVTSLTPFNPELDLLPPDQAARALMALEMFGKTAILR